MASNFKVVIAGGSVAGLSLAKMLETVGIDFVLLEAYPSIAPQVGASIGLLGNGLRILDQLGCYEDIRRVAPDCLTTATLRSSNGIFKMFGGLDRMFMERFGYPFVFMDRQTLLQVLYSFVKDKTKIHVNKRVTEVQMTETGVTVLCKDGSEFSGDILVGGDGIRSTVRQQMWKIAERCSPGYIPSSEYKAMKCDYACMFGISQPKTGGLEGGETINILREHYSCFVVGGTGDKTYWFLFLGLGKTAYGDDIPRFTREDEDRIVKEHSGLLIRDDMTFGDLYSCRSCCVMTPLEECVFKKWHYGRILTIGDAAHKIHPLSGQGGNSAIESAAALVNFLTRAQKQKPHLSSADIQHVFQQVQTLRQSRTEKLMRIAHMRQRLEAMETPYLKFTALHVLPRFGSEVVFQRFYDTVAPAGKLDNLPVPKRLRRAPFEDELPARPRSRGAEMTLIAAAFVCLASIAWKLVYSEYHSSPGIVSQRTGNVTRVGGAFTSTRAQILFGPLATTTAFQPPMKIQTSHTLEDGASYLHQLYHSISLFSYVTIWTIEGSRTKNMLPSMFLPLIWGYLFQNYGFGVIAPFYYMANIYSGKSLRDFLPFGNFLPMSRARAILPAVLIGYLFPTLLMLSPFGNPKLQHDTASFWQAWPLYLSVLTILFTKAFTFADKGAGAKDLGLEISHVKHTYLVVFVITALAHIGTVCTCLMSPSLSLKSVFIGPALDGFITSPPEIQAVILFRRDMLLFTLSSLVWLIVSVSELNRVGVLVFNWKNAVVPIVLGSLCVGPGTVAAAVWYYRELIVSKNWDVLQEEVGTSL